MPALLLPNYLHIDSAATEEHNFGTFWACLPFSVARELISVPAFYLKHSVPSGMTFDFLEGEISSETSHRLRGSCISSMALVRKGRYAPTSCLGAVSLDDPTQHGNYKSLWEEKIMDTRMPDALKTNWNGSLRL